MRVLGRWGGGSCIFDSKGARDVFLYIWGLDLGFDG